jgi:hypothetical protein
MHVVVKSLPISLPLTALSVVCVESFARLPSSLARSTGDRSSAQLPSRRPPHSSVAMSQEDIIPKEKGTQKVQSEGIGPFLSFIESAEREFFKAKDFVTLYDLIFKMCIQVRQQNARVNVCMRCAMERLRTSAC